MRILTISLAALVAAAGLPPQPAAAQSGGVAVLRGSAASVEAPARRGAPVVLRGAGSREEAPTTPPPARRITIAGGSVLWLVADNGGVAACTLRSSGTAGRDVIHCTQGVVSR